MELISFKCTSCKQNLKVGADKAGRKIKCTKCGTELTIPKSGPAEAKAPAAPEPPPKKPDDDDDDDKKGYSLLADTTPADADQKKPEVKPKKKEKVAPLKRKFKTLSDPDLWEKVKMGLQIIMVGTNVWGGVVLFMVLMVFLGILNGPEYAEVAEKNMTVKTDTPAGELVSMDTPAFMFGLVTGITYEGIGKIFYVLATILSLFQIIVLVAGYAICLSVPDRFGTKGQIGALLAFGAINFFLILFFKLLPALGMMNYIMVPFALPEVSLVDANIDRDPPIWVIWSASPFWEMLVTVLFICFYYLEPVLIGVFVWSIGLSLREEPIVNKGQGLVGLSLGITFTLMSYQLLSMAGTSSVVLTVLRLVYVGWVAATILLIVRLPIVLQATRTILQKYLDGAELADEQDAEAEEREVKKPKPKGKTKRARDDEDDDDDDDDD